MSLAFTANRPQRLDGKKAKHGRLCLCSFRQQVFLEDYLIKWWATIGHFTVGLLLKRGSTRRHLLRLVSSGSSHRALLLKVKIPAACNGRYRTRRPHHPSRRTLGRSSEFLAELLEQRGLSVWKEIGEHRLSIVLMEVMALDAVWTSHQRLTLGTRSTCHAQHVLEYWPWMSILAGTSYRPCPRSCQAARSPACWK